jgi:hypothetical protein
MTLLAMGDMMETRDDGYLKYRWKSVTESGKTEDEVG